jgi:hypothetical protein
MRKKGTSADPPRTLADRCEIKPSPQNRHDGGCEARLDLVFARARQSLRSHGPNRTDILKPLTLPWSSAATSRAATEGRVRRISGPIPPRLRRFPTEDESNRRVRNARSRENMRASRVVVLFPPGWREPPSPLRRPPGFLLSHPTALAAFISSKTLKPVI